MTFEAISPPPRSGTPGEASPQQAEKWLEDWRKIGGGITIAIDQGINPWRFIPAGLDRLTRLLADSLERELIRELDETPGLAAAVRVVISMNALSTLRDSLKKMAKDF